MLKEDIVTSPLPPYFDSELFSTISQATDSGHNVSKMSTRQWYEFLMEEEFTTQNQETPTRNLIPCRVESLHPELDWSLIWSNVRSKCFSPDMISFAFKLLHDLLPHEAKLSTILPNSTAICRYGCSDDSIANTNHIFFECKSTHQVGRWLLNTVRKKEPQLTKESLLNLQMMDKPVLWIATATLQFMWDSRCRGKIVQVNEAIAKLMSDLNILKTTKYEKVATLAMVQIST